MITIHDQPLLVAEDSDEDFAVFQRFMKRLDVQNPIYRCSNGDEVLDFLYLEGDYQGQTEIPRPSVILLDLNLPGLDGRELLKKIKQDESFRKIPIVVFTTSSNPDDVELCYQRGANGYLIKPVGTPELQKTIQSFVNFWLETNTPPSVKKL
ncbi:two-component system response regulator [Aphanothece hegewaldii CCALA 016]|uniref:Two-component system response regulator n=1 Tax=Aphanothece hegewaldii CCALA 016 TaxID=2107694 RepID=A0A2T1M416_9CHRO|nr:response regulator [Aphanothece hegewaldii]PSF39556.1 two-component system response regulator [Aphanothece hegewaldii CCALA 016]